jgi:hypothetical protein
LIMFLLCRELLKLILLDEPLPEVVLSQSSRYLEQNVRHSPATYASAIDPSGRDLFHT